MGAGDQVRLGVLDQVPGSHSGVDPLELPGFRRRLARLLGNERILHAVHGQELGVVKIPDHAVMGEILEEQGDPVLRIGPHGEVDRLLVDLAPDFYRVALGFDGDRLSASASAVVRYLRLRCPHVDDRVARILPLLRGDAAINPGR